MSYKVLELRTFGAVLDEEDLVECGLKEIKPILNRTGFYYDRYKKIAWVEAFGRAWLCDRVDDFIYRLNLLNHKEFDDVELKAIKTLMNRGICPKELKQKYYLDKEVKYLKNLRYDIIKFRIECIGR